MKFCLILPAGGLGIRFGDGIPKQFMKIEGKPIIIHTLKVFENIIDISKIYIPVNPGWTETLSGILKEYEIKKEVELIEGGKERQDSVLNALSRQDIIDYEYIIIHDAVRPLVSVKLIRELIDTAVVSGSAIPYIIPKDTIRYENHDLTYKIIDREKLRAIQTPQIFRTDLIIKAYENAKDKGLYSTDDAALIEAIGQTPVLIQGEETNIKITTKYDLLFAESIISEMHHIK